MSKFEIFDNQHEEMFSCITDSKFSNLLERKTIDEKDKEDKEDKEEIQDTIEYRKNNEVKEAEFNTHLENKFNNFENKVDNWSKYLDRRLIQIAEDITEEFSIENKFLLNSDLSLNNTGFKQKYEGSEIHYSNNEIKEDNKKIRKIEKVWIEKSKKSIKEYLSDSNIDFSEVELKNILNLYSKDKKEFWTSKDNQKATDAIFEQFERNKQKRMGILWEKAKTVLCNDLLGSKFVTVRSSKFDDCQNGIDNIIIDKSNGDVVCAFDEINALQKSIQYEDKLDKIEFENQQGGAKIKYGITIQDKKILRTQYENIPIFALRISFESLILLLESQSSGNSHKKNREIEIDTFDRLLNSLEKQIGSLKTETNLTIPLSSFEKMREIIEEKKKNV